MYFWCEARISFDDDQCKTELGAFQLCGSQTTKPSIPQKNMAATITQEFVFPKSFFPYSHVCSLVENEDESLLAIFNAGTSEDAKDSTIYFSIRDPVNQTWSLPKVAARLQGTCVMNPSVYQNSEGKIFLTFHYGGSWLDDGKCNTDNWSGAYVISSNGGFTWGNIQYFPQGYLGSVKNKCIRLKDGKVLCGTSTEAFVNNFIEYWQSHIEITDDNFSSWKKSNFIHFNYDKYSGNFCPYYGNIQPTLVELENDTILAFVRTGCSVIGQAMSYDGGLTFSAFASSTIIPNPNAGIDSVMMKDQTDLGTVLIFNNSNRTRTPLTIASSTDAGVTWNILFNVESNLTLSYEYPAIIQSKAHPRTAHSCYSYHSPEGNTIAYSKIEFPDPGSL
jgi:predicted neuraminidase